MTSLALLQLSSPALPVGAFSYSEGLESLVHSALLLTDRDVQSWLQAELQRGYVRIEAASLVLFVQDFQCWILSPDLSCKHRLLELDSFLLATREAAEVRAQQQQMGASLIHLLEEMGYPLPEALDLAWPAAWAWASLSLSVPVQDMVEGYLYSWVANQISAAVRLVPLGPTCAQVLQFNLMPQIYEQASQLMDVDPFDLWNTGVGLSMAQLSHEELYSRLFRS